MIYEVINPSDMVTFFAQNDEVAAAVVLYLGQGAYACKSQDGRTVLPILAFGGSDKWFAENQKVTDLRNSDEGLAQIAEALMTTAYCRAEDREYLWEELGGRQLDPKALEDWNETKRTSMNNICGRARKIAAQLREPRVEPT